MKSTFSILLLLSCFFTYGQSIKELEFVIQRIESEKRMLVNERTKLEAKLIKLKSSPEYASINYEELPKNEVLQIAKVNYDKFKLHTSHLIVEGNWYFIVLPSTNELVLAKLQAIEKRKRIFKNNNEVFELKKDYRKFYDWDTVIRTLPQKSSDKLDDFYLRGLNNFESKINQKKVLIEELETQISVLEDALTKTKAEKERFEAEREVYEKEQLLKILNSSKFKPNQKAYHKSLNGKVVILGEPSLSSWNYIPHEVLERDYLTEEEFKKAFSSKYGYSNYQKIRAGKIHIGDIKEIIPYIFGLPDDINKSVGSWGVHEQWVFRSQGLYIYVENGIIKSWQE